MTYYVLKGLEAVGLVWDLHVATASRAVPRATPRRRAGRRGRSASRRVPRGLKLSVPTGCRGPGWPRSSRSRGPGRGAPVDAADPQGAGVAGDVDEAFFRREDGAGIAAVCRVARGPGLSLSRQERAGEAHGEDVGALRITVEIAVNGDAAVATTAKGSPRSLDHTWPPSSTARTEALPPKVTPLKAPAVGMMVVVHALAVVVARATAPSPTTTKPRSARTVAARNVAAVPRLTVAHVAPPSWVTARVPPSPATMPVRSSAKATVRRAPVVLAFWRVHVVPLSTVWAT